MKEKIALEAKRRQLEAEAEQLAMLSRQEDIKSQVYTKVEDPYDLNKLTKDDQQESKS